MTNGTTEAAPAGDAGHDGLGSQTLVHFYRGELQRSDTWRTRLDTTTNWAVGTTAAILSVGFSSPDVPTAVFPFVGCLLLLFLSIEARHYRYYVAAVARVRALERALLGPVLASREPDRSALAALAEDLEHPKSHMTHRDALAIRLWLTYGWLFAIVYVAWFARIWMMPWEIDSAAQAIQRIRAGPLPGSVVLVAAVLYFAWVAWLTAKGRRLWRGAGGRVHGTPLAPTKRGV